MSGAGGKPLRGLMNTSKQQQQQNKSSEKQELQSLQTQEQQCVRELELVRGELQQCICDLKQLQQCAKSAQLAIPLLLMQIENSEARVAELMDTVRI
jgi:hypothetical protein